MAPELAKIELSLVAENKEKEEAKQKENMKVKFEALTSSSVLDDYSTSDSADFRHGSTSFKNIENSVMDHESWYNELRTGRFLPFGLFEPNVADNKRI